MLENLCKVRIPVVLLGNFPVFPVLIKGLFVTADFRQFPLSRSNQFFQTDGLTLFDRGGVNADNHFRVGNSQMDLLLYCKEDSGLQTIMLD